MEFREKYREFFNNLDAKYFDKDRFVPAIGPEEANFMLVGEAPGANEVEKGEPFVGRAGKKLDEILHDISIPRNELYITNLVKVRPPDNRNPKKNEIQAWKPLLEKEIENVQPETIIPLGNFASRQLLGVKKGITSIHGKLFTREGQKIMPAFHPAAVLYDRSKEPLLEKDLRKAFGKEETGQTSLENI